MPGRSKTGSQASRASVRCISLRAFCSMESGGCLDRGPPK